MKLKYYLRGIGIGVLVTTIIFMISISLHKNDANPKNEENQKDTSMTIEALENSTEGTGPQPEQNSETAKKEETEGQKQKNETLPTGTEEEQEPSEAVQKKDAEQEAKQPKTELPESDPQPESKIPFEVGNGEYSDVVCRKLAEAGLVDDANAFNQFMVENDYDNFILPGTYDIPKDSTYEEIARLLTGKN